MKLEIPNDELEEVIDGLEMAIEANDEAATAELLSVEEKEAARHSAALLRVTLSRIQNQRR